MRTATEDQIRTQTVNIAPAPCRMIRVQVFNDLGDGNERWGISWVHVVGIMCAPSIEFPKLTDLWPVVIGNSPQDGELCVADDFHDPANMRHKAVVPCFWPPEQDQENAVRIGKELIEGDGELGNWVSLPDDREPFHP